VRTFKKAVVWGHKIGTHTHSYVHFGYWRALQQLGYETEWFDDNDDVSGVDFSDTVFITETNVSKRMPIRSDCVYFDHFSDRPFELTGNQTQARLTHPHYYNFVFFSDRWVPEWNSKWPVGDELEYLSQHHYYHEKTKTLTTMWATDLLPDEIDQVEPKLFDENVNQIFFVGTPQGQNIKLFEEICNRHQKFFTNVGGWNAINAKVEYDINVNIELVRGSYISVDIRDHPHLVQGRYYPCRLFKNISYGRWTGSNHEGIEDVFGTHFTCHSDLEVLYDRLVEDSRNCTESKLRDAMNFVRDHHTYVNRVQDMFKVL
jgi:hypothetical protein